MRVFGYQLETEHSRQRFDAAAGADHCETHLLIVQMIRGHSGDAIRCLFRRGDSFDVDDNEAFPDISGDPLILLGAYGTGARPFLDASNLTPQVVFELYGECHNWAFVDLEFEKAGHALLDRESTGEIWDLNGNLADQTGLR